MNTRQLNKRVSLLMALLVVSTSAMAGRDYDEKHARGKYEDYAKVKSVTPEYESVNHPRQVCSDEYIQGGGHRHEPAYSERSYTGTVLGGITGALIGSRFGKGNGNSGAIAAGAIAGAVIGDKMQYDQRRTSYEDDSHDRRGRVVQRCRSEDNWEKRLTGYRVVYEYAGRSYTTMMTSEPGHTIPVRVSVVPAID